MTQPIDLAALNRGHRERQAANAVAVQRLVARLFVQMVDPVNIAVTAQAWMIEAIAAILQGRRSSFLLASAYAMAVRRIQVPDAPRFEIPRPPDPPMEKLVRSLTYTGPGKLAVDLAKTPAPVEPPREAPAVDWERFDRELEGYQKALKELPVRASVMASAAAYRHVSDAGRDTIDTVITSDPVAVGYIRIAKDTPCAFCLMLSSRGPVYKGDSFARSDPRFTGPGNHKVHDACGCQLQPIYGGKSLKHWTDQARKAEALWLNGDGHPEDDRPPTSYSGNEAINAFARAARRMGIADLNRW